jgi:hypothetical protein
MKTKLIVNTIGVNALFLTIFLFSIVLEYAGTYTWRPRLYTLSKLYNLNPINAQECHAMIYVEDKYPLLSILLLVYNKIVNLLIELSLFFPFIGIGSTVYFVLSKKV